MTSKEVTEHRSFNLVGDIFFMLDCVIQRLTRKPQEDCWNRDIKLLY